MSNNAGRPVCNINAKVPAAQPVVSPYPAIVRAYDLPSAIKAINQIANFVQILGDQFNQFNPPGEPQARQAAGIGNFREIRQERQTEDVKIVDPNDPEVFVEVRQITGLAFKENGSGKKIVWKR